MNKCIHRCIRGRKVIVFLALGVLFSVLPASSANAAIFEPGFEVETVSGGFTLPTAMAFAPDGRIFVAEKGGSVRVVKNGVLLPTPVITLTDINTFGDRGLIGITTDPNFAANGYLYLSYTYENTPGSNFSGPKTGRIVRVTVTGDTASESSKVIIMGTVGGNLASPSCDNFPLGTDCIPSDSMSHSVGGLHFGPDGNLYATLGDGANFDVADPRSLRAQDLDSLAGKVVRINTDGTAPSTNPFYTGDPNANRSKVYAYGVRNAFRFNFHPATGALFLGDVGWSTWEEINHVTAGSNYGWPCYEGLSTTSHNCTAPDVTNPTYVYAHDVNGAGSVTAGSFPSNSAYPTAYDNSFFFGDYAQNWIKRLVIDANNSVVSVNDFMDNPDGPVDVETGPDGNIYYLSIYTGELHRLTHTTGNLRPVVEIVANPTSGLAPLEVAFTSFGSYDPENSSLVYEWNFDDGSFSSEANPTHTFTANGTYEVVMTLTDAQGSSASKSITITVGNQKPSPEITSPQSGALYTPGSTIALSGTATDPENGTLGASAFNWQIILHHNTHIHIIQEFNGVTNPSFPAPDHGSSDVYVEVILTVTDSGGLSNQRSINLYMDTGAGAGNLISNPSLETPDVIPGTPFRWIKGGYGVNDPVFTYPVPGFEGVNAAKVEVTSYVSGDAKWYFDPVFVSPGNEYVLTHYYTANVSTPLIAQFGLQNGTYQYAALATLPPTATPTLSEQHITVPAGVQTLTVFNEMDKVGALTVDNYSLTLAAAVPDTTAPTVSVISPANASTLSGTVAVSVNATDAGGVEHVTLLVDNIATGTEDAVAPYEFMLNTSLFTNGPHTISALAHDASNNMATATPVNVTISNGTTSVNLVQNPTLEIGAPGNPNIPANWTPSSWGNHTAVFGYPVTGYNAGKAARVEITSYPANGTGDAKWFFDDVAVTPGTAYTYKDHYRSNTISDIIGRYTLTNGTVHYFGLAKEIQPNTNWQSINATFTPPVDATAVTFFHLISAVGFVEIDDVELYATGTSTPSETNDPIVEFTNPLQGQTLSGVVGITASSTDDTAVTYIFYAVDGIPVTGQITQPPYLFNWDTTTVGNGQHTLKATTHDPSGNNSTHTITVTVDNTAPPSGNNLIANPSLETAGAGGDPANWLRGGWGTNNRVFTYPVAGVDGVKAAKVEITSYTSGDAKWYFTDVPVTAGGTYTFTHAYKSNASTELVARYQTPAGVQYGFLTTLPASTNWATSTRQIVVPANATAITIFHILHSVGVLETDAFSLTNNATVPEVHVTSPTEGSTVSGTIDITATAGGPALTILGVQFILDGVDFGSEDTVAPYTISLNTTTLTNGAHTISARARGDVPGSTGTSAIVNITINNTPPSGNNLIANPSLETAGAGGDPANWLRGGWGTNNRVFTYPVAGVDGAAAAKVEITSYTSGDAKWYFTDVPVTAGGTYTFTHAYRSNAPSIMTARYTKTDGTVQYVGLRNLAASPSWNSVMETITIPAGVASLTIFHSLTSVGWLEIDNHTLTSGNSDTFTRGMVSLTFDDGWLSHYTNVLPLLNAEGVKGTFFIVSDETAQAVPDERIQNPSLETAGAGGDPANWLRGGWGTNNRVFTYPVAGVDGVKAAKVEITSYTSGDAKWYFGEATVIPNQKYILKDSYNSTVSSETVVRYTLASSTVQYAFLNSLPSTNGTWQNFERTITIPANAVSVTLFHLIANVGSLTVDNYSLKRVQMFVDPVQMLAMQSAGHEIGAHSKTHPDLTTLTLAEQQNEIGGSRTDILGMGGTPVDTFAYPFGAYNTGIKTIAQNTGYVAARGVDRGYNVKTTDKYALKIQQVNRLTTLAEVQAWTNQAAQDKTWLILMFHQIDGDPLTELGTTPEMLQQFVDYIKTANVDIVKMRDGVALMTP